MRNQTLMARHATQRMALVTGITGDGNQWWFINSNAMKWAMSQ
jgi:hypothetical protein